MKSFAAGWMKKKIVWITNVIQFIFCLKYSCLSNRVIIILKCNDEKCSSSVFGFPTFRRPFKNNCIDEKKKTANYFHHNWMKLLLELYKKKYCRRTLYFSENNVWKKYRLQRTTSIKIPNKFGNLIEFLRSKSLDTIPIYGKDKVVKLCMECDISVKYIVMLPRMQCLCQITSLVSECNAISFSFGQELNIQTVKSYNWM